MPKIGGVMRMQRILAAGISLSMVVWGGAGTDGISAPSAGKGGHTTGSGGAPAGNVGGSGDGGGAIGRGGASSVLVTTSPVDGGGQLKGDSACVATAMEGEQRPVAL